MFHLIYSLQVSIRDGSFFVFALIRRRSFEMKNKEKNCDKSGNEWIRMEASAGDVTQQ